MNSGFEKSCVTEVQTIKLKLLAMSHKTLVLYTSESSIPSMESELHKINTEIKLYLLHFSKKIKFTQHHP